MATPDTSSPFATGLPMGDGAPGQLAPGITNGRYDFHDFQAPDYYQIDDLLPEDAKRRRDDIRAFVDRDLLPVIEEHAQAMTFPRHLLPAIADLGLLGPTIPTAYGGLGADSLTYGLMMQEIERADSGLRSFCSVMSSLVMYPIYTYGSEEQRQRWLPALAKAEAIGCFALTEPNVGSNPNAMEMRAHRDGDDYILVGHKRWSTNASEADVCVVWAIDDDGQVGGFLVEMDRPGVSAPRIMNKWSLRAAITSEVLFDHVRIPAANRLPNAKGMKAPLSCLTQARYGIAWGVIGAAMACYDAARQHAVSREQFGRPIGGFQLIQAYLAEMLTEITKAQLLAWRLGTLKDGGAMRPQQVSMAKRANCEMALKVARQARQMLGANGVLGIYPVMRHMMNLESVVTYEGTHEVHTLVLGQDITGLNAFSG